MAIPIPIFVLSCVTTLSVNVFDVPDPDHKGNVCPVPEPSKTEELSIFCQESVAPTSTNTAQSPVTQSVIPSKSTDPEFYTI